MYYIICKSKQSRVGQDWIYDIGMMESWIRKFSSCHESLSFPCLSEFNLKVFHMDSTSSWSFLFSLNNRFASTVFPLVEKYYSSIYFLLLSQWTASVSSKDKRSLNRLPFIACLNATKLWSQSLNVLLMFILYNNNLLAWCIIWKH